MRLDDFLLNQGSVIDLTALPPPKRQRRYPDGRKIRERRGAMGHSYVENPYGDLTPDEISMAKSGASYEDIMFLRAMQMQDMDGFSPYFNPNIDHSKKRKK